MSAGPGKYDDLCTLVRERSKADGAIVIIFNGKYGNGFAVQTDRLTTISLPNILEEMAKQIRSDVESIFKEEQ